MMRYVIHADYKATWFIVCSSGTPRLHVERLGLRGDRSCFALDVFEASDIGRRLGPYLDASCERARNSRFYAPSH